MTTIEASYAEAKYQLLHTIYNQYLIHIIVVIYFALYCGVPVFEYRQEWLVKNSTKTFKAHYE